MVAEANGQNEEEWRHSMERGLLIQKIGTNTPIWGAAAGFDAELEHTVRSFQQERLAERPGELLHVDTKKRELIGWFKNSGASHALGLGEGPERAPDPIGRVPGLAK